MNEEKTVIAMAMANTQHAFTIQPNHPVIFSNKGRICNESKIMRNKHPVPQITLFTTDCVLR